MVEKHRAVRQIRLDRYRRSGRTVTISPDTNTASFESWRSEEDQVAQPQVRSTGKRILDGVLLLIEISAVVGFIYILYSGLNVIQELNREVVAVIEQPTLTPTPLIGAIVLPSGHTPPDSPGGSRFNEEEIPDHLRPLVQSLFSAPIATPGPEQATRIQLPAIQIDAPIVQGDGWDQLKKGVGQHFGSGNPGEPGNLVLSAHNDIFGELFRNLDRLNPGDLVVVYTN